MADRSPAHTRGAISLAQCGIHARPERLREELLAAASDYFDVKHREEALSKQEQSLAKELILNKYSTDTWNLEGIGT
jgi:lipoate-protein ligase A